MFCARPTFAEPMRVIPEVQQIQPKTNSPKSDVEYLALTIWGEARNQTEDEMMKVGSVILNRLNHNKFPYTCIKEVVMAPGQFHVWKRSNPNYNKMMNINRLPRESKDYLAYKKALRVATSLLQNGPTTSALYFSAGRSGNNFRNNF